MPFFGRILHTERYMKHSVLEIAREKGLKLHRCCTLKASLKGAIFYSYKITTFILNRSQSQTTLAVFLEYRPLPSRGKVYVKSL